MNAPPFTLTNQTIVVVLNGETHVVQKGAPNFMTLRSALVEERWEDVADSLTVAKSIQVWAKGKFKVIGDVVHYDGVPLPSDLNSRITSMAAAGEDPTPVCNFWERLQNNPSKRSVDQLWSFLKHQGIPLTPEGKFLAYKSVRSDYKDHHSGNYDNSPGTVNEMPRNQISDDPNHACHEGFHVGALEYASKFGSGPSVVVICEIDPADVVCIPYDSSAQKMRVSKYKVIGIHNGEYMPDTTVDDDYIGVSDDDDDYDSYEDSMYEDDDDEIDIDAEDREDDDGVSYTVSLPKDSTQDLRGVPEKIVQKTKRARHRFDKMDMGDLMDESLEDLRKYASKTLKIVGASKIPGGKVSLVFKIMDVRG